MHLDENKQSAASASAPKFHFGLRALFVLIAIVSVLSGIVAAVNRTFSARRGAVVNRAEWPQPLQELLVQAGSAQIDVEPVRVYCVQDFTEKYYFCRMRPSPELIALMTSQWGLTPRTPVDVSRFWEKWPGNWERAPATPSGPQNCLVNWQKPSNNFAVVVDGSPPVAYAYYWFNF